MTPQPALREAAQAILDRWNSPAWEWHKQGPTADLMADLRAALASQAPAEQTQDSFHQAQPSGKAATAQPAKPAEIRNNSLGKLDEFFADNANVHLEQMNDGHWWMGVTMPDGAMWHLNFSTKRNTAISVFVECDAPAAPGSADNAVRPTDEKESCVPAVSALQGWQPIETAPKDGRWVQLFGRHPRGGCEQISARWWAHHADDEGCWECGDDQYQPYMNPTHWMPLPPPPIEGAQHG